MMDRNPITNWRPKQGVQPQTNKMPKRPFRTLQLTHISPNLHTAISPTMSSSPTTPRRRAALTPSQAWRHASGSFYPPEPHHEEWIYCGEKTIPEASSPNFSTTSKGTTSPHPNYVSAPIPLSETYSLSSTLYTTPLSSRPRSRSHPGVNYSTSHRRVPSSPSFRSTLTLAPHSYFDRPPSPTSSISSRSSEPLISASLSLSELLRSTTNISLGEPLTDGADVFIRRETQREERKQAMKERHVAIRERREQEKCAKAQTRC
ncbi:hypothetical protein ACGC1H_002952 [Rhizoctonia solani]